MQAYTVPEVQASTANTPSDPAALGAIATNILTNIATTIVGKILG